MINVKDIRVINALSLDFLLIQYSIDDTVEDLSNYRFDIYRSNSPAGSFQLIFQDAASFEYKDYSVNLYNPAIQYYYRIKVKNLKDGKEHFSDITGQLLYNNPDNVANSVIEQYRIYLETLNNPPIKILLRRRFGQKCQVCWDDVRMQPKLDYCTSCYSTGYTNGYFSPITVNMSYLSGSESFQQTIDMADVGQSENPIQIWISNYPIVNTGDIIVDSINRRYEVIKCDPTTRRGYVTRQVLTLKRLPKSDIIYEYPV